MGGKALTTLTQVRLPRAAYLQMQSRVLPIVSSLYERAAVPHFLPTKPDFGDLDIVVAGPRAGQKDPVSVITTHFKSAQVVKSGPTTSFDVDGFQVDLISCSVDEFDATVAFLSWGDLGGII
ncbi:hypothetical protein HK104_006780, partial [Borealophlyctis nickersoniae]